MKRGGIFSVSKSCLSAVTITSFAKNFVRLVTSSFENYRFDGFTYQYHHFSFFKVNSDLPFKAILDIPLAFNSLRVILQCTFSRPPNHSITSSISLFYQPWLSIVSAARSPRLDIMFSSCVRPIFKRAISIHNSWEGGTASRSMAQFPP